MSVAWSEGGQPEIRLKPTSIELTLQMGVTSSRSGRAGVKWWLFEVGGDRGRETVATQTVRLVLEPEFPGAAGRASEPFDDLQDGDDHFDQARMIAPD